MRVWIDLANSPQVLFFRPIIPALRRRGCAVDLTSRRFAQTVELADRYGWGHTVVGGRSRRGAVAVLRELIGRAFALSSWARPHRFDLAVSHGSYAMALAARALGLRTVTLMDFEGQPANHLSFRLAHRVVVPRVFPTSALRRFGVTEDRVRRYDGLKEEVYLADFRPTEGFRLHADWPDDAIIATLRPPMHNLTYHRAENRLFPRLIEFLLDQPRVRICLLPRGRASGDDCPLPTDRVYRPTRVLDGPDLIAHSDLVVTGGGTMGREAAVLGTPAVSIFEGKLPAVDAHLVAAGKLLRVCSEDDFARIPLRKRRPGRPSRRPALVEQVVDHILEVPTREVPGWPGSVLVAHNGDADKEVS